MATVPTSVVFVDTAAAARDVCKPLLDAAADAADGSFDVRIALDLEGRDLGPSGQIAVVSIATSLHSVALFDFADRSVARAILEEGLLADVLQHPAIAKLMFDCRMDVGALFYQFDVTVRHVVDLQIAAVQRLLRPGAPFLIGMHKTFNDKLMLFTAADAKSKDAGRFLFAPEKGGQYEAWFARPMAPALQDYCAVDVKYFFAAAQKLAPSDLALRNCATLSLKRVTRVTTERVENCSAERDF